MNYVSSILSSLKGKLPSIFESVSNTGSPMSALYESARKIKEYFNSSLNQVDAFVGPIQDHIESISPEELFTRGTIPIDCSIIEHTSISVGPCVLALPIDQTEYEEILADLRDSIHAASSAPVPTEADGDVTDPLAITLTDKSGNAYCIRFDQNQLPDIDGDIIMDAWMVSPTLWEGGTHPFGSGAKPILYRKTSTGKYGDQVNYYADPLLYSVNLQVKPSNDQPEQTLLIIESGAITTIQALLVELTASASLSSFLGFVSEILISAKDSAAATSVIMSEAAKYKYSEIKQAANGIVQSIARSGFVGGIQYILQYFQRLVNALESQSGDSAISFTDNEALVPQIFIVGAVTKIVTAMVDVVATVLTAIKPVIGIAISAITNVVSGFIEAINPENLTRGSVATIQAFTQPCYPIGLFQRTLINNENGPLEYLVECINQSPSGSIMIDIPFGRFICGRGSTHPVYDTDTIIFEFHPFLADFRKSCSAFNSKLLNVINQQDRLTLTESLAAVGTSYRTTECILNLRDDDGALWSLFDETILSAENPFSDPSFINDSDGSLNSDQDRDAREICAVNSYLAEMYIILSYQKWYRDHYNMVLPLSQEYKIQLGYSTSGAPGTGYDVYLWVPGGLADFPDFSPLSFVTYRPSVSPTDPEAMALIGSDITMVGGQLAQCTLITAGTGSFGNVNDLSTQQFLCTWTDLAAHMARYVNDPYHDIFLQETTAYEFFYLISAGYCISVEAYQYAEWCFTLPKIEASSFWAIIIGSATVLAITSAAIVVSSILMKRRRQKRNAERNLAISKAKQQYESNPTPDNYEQLRKLVNKANLRASIFGGSRYTDSGAVAFPSVAPISKASQVDSLAESETAGKIDQMIVADIDSQAISSDTTEYKTPLVDITLNDVLVAITGNR